MTSVVNVRSKWKQAKTLISMCFASVLINYLYILTNFNCFLQIQSNRFVCYPVQAAPRTDISTSYYVTSDPEDPAFYSTCWVRKPPVLLATPSPPAQKPPALWQFGIDKCIHCSWALRNQIVNKTSLWPVRNHARCVNCDNPPIKYVASGYGPNIYANPTLAKYNSTHTTLPAHRMDGWDSLS